MSPSPARVRSTIAAAVVQPDDLRQLRAFHKVMADVNRLRIVRRLADGDATVTELVDHVGLSQPLVSWHLNRLRATGVVETRRQGRETICRLREEAFAEFAARQRAALGLVS
jgi:DNA-binding transcriptional ArsR family regulator